MKSVFLVDDDDHYRELVQLTLQEDCGVERVLAFAGGRSLLEHLAQHPGEPPGLLLLDLHMPEMGGLEVLRQARQLVPLLPVVFLSGAAAEEERAACLAAGAASFLAKPVAYSDLVGLLQELLRTLPDAPPA